MQQIGVGHDAVLDERVFAGNDEVIPNVRFRWTLPAVTFDRFHHGTSSLGSTVDSTESNQKGIRACGI